MPLRLSRASDVRRGKQASILAVVIAAMAHVHCAGCSHKPTDADAGDVVDGSRDTGVVPFDSGVVTDVADVVVPSCDAISDTPERWRRLPYACGCDGRIALAPQNAAPPLRWQQCAGSDDCLRLVVDWSSREAPNDIFSLIEYRVGGQRWIGYRRDDPPTRRARILFGPLDGAPTIAWESRDLSGGGPLGCYSDIEPGPTPAVLMWWPIDGIGNVLRYALSLGAISNVPEWLDPSVELVEPRWSTVVIPYVSVYERSAATTLGGTLWRSNPTSRRFEAIAQSDALGGLVEATQLWGDQSWFLLSRRDNDVALWVVEGNQPPREVYRPSPARSLEYRVFEDFVVLFASDVQRDGGNIRETVQMFVAPRTTDPARFVPRLLWNMPAGVVPSPRGRLVSGGGWMAFNVRAPGGDWMVLVRASDGARIELRDRRPDVIAWVDADELAHSVRRDGRFTYERIKMRTLGPVLPME